MVGGEYRISEEYAVTKCKLFHLLTVSSSLIIIGCKLRSCCCSEIELQGMTKINLEDGRSRRIRIVSIYKYRVHICAIFQTLRNSHQSHLGRDADIATRGGREDGRCDLPPGRWIIHPAAGIIDRPGDESERQRLAATTFDISIGD